MIQEEKIKVVLASGEEREAFTMIVETYQQRVYWHIRRIVLDHDDANDVTQNTFIKVYNNLVSFEGKSKIFSWIYRIATNEAINFINQKARRNAISFEEVSVQLAGNLETDSFFNGDEAELKLQKAIAILPEKQRLVFQMKYYEELKYSEISDILETSVGALKASYHHAVKKIERALLSQSEIKLEIQGKV